MKEISKALVNAQSEMSNPTKTSNNPFFKSKYADLNAVREAVLPILNKHGISVIQPIVQVDGKNFVKTMLLHESGESIESFTEIVVGRQNDAQAQGSGITYARRYGLQSLVCVGADDDDGNEASKQPKQEVKQVNQQFPSITEKALTQAIERIANGEKGIKEKILKAFTLTHEQVKKIDEAINLLG
jgi:hypothetical protein